MTTVTLDRTQNTPTPTHATPERAPGGPERPRAKLAAPVDVHETREAFLVLADLPGVAPGHVDLHYERGQLSFTAEGEGAFGPVEYRRSFVLPQGIDADKIEADLSDGVLRVTLPKASALRPRQIQVRGA
jgi:HSP20 family protein